MPYTEVSRQDWEAKRNGKNCLKIIDKCRNISSFRGKSLRYCKTRVVVDGADEPYCWFWYAARGNSDCIIEPRIHNSSVRTVKTLLTQAGFEPAEHGDRIESHSTTIKIPVNVDQISKEHTWSCIEDVLTICAKGT